jgi:hypothetical protein
VISRAIARAMEDALDGVMLRFVQNVRLEASMRQFARDFAWRRVITLLADAEWEPPGVEAPRARKIAAAAELEAILLPVFRGEGAVTWSSRPDRPRAVDP